MLKSTFYSKFNSHWQEVFECYRSTHDLMVEFYMDTKKGLDKAKALQEKSHSPTIRLSRFCAGLEEKSTYKSLYCQFN